MARKTVPKPWQREHPGRYRSSDGRFAIEQGDPGRWFLTDEEARNEFGLPLTLGPFGTLDDAKEAADQAREAPPAESPLAERLAEAAKRPPEPPKRRPRGAQPDRTERRTPARPAPEPAEPPEPPEPVEPASWLDGLAAGESARVRRLIADLGRLGVDDAEAVVRRDLETLEPAVADALLRRFVESRAVEPWTDRRVERLEKTDASLHEALDAARRAGLSEAQVRALARQIASATVAAALEAVSDFDRHPDADRRLPGWELLERRSPSEPSPARRMHVREPDRA